jgi:outer membrane biosynthesis protein TonB
MASKAQLRNRAVPAMATLVLMIVLGLVYFVSTRTAHSPAPASITDTPVTAPTANPVVTEQPADTNQTPPPPAAEASDAAVTTKEEPKTETTKAAATAPAKKSTVKTTNTQTKPAEETKKDDSKVGSILKKTGRILKKPFKF